MVDRVREILLSAVSAGRFGAPPEASVAQAVAKGDRDFTIDRLNFDSLAWMEFCIAVELQSGQELTPADLEDMQFVFEIEEWLRARL
jgi:acyl carrier protein